MDVDERYNSLQAILGVFDKIIIAYSGGVDSTFLLKASIDTLGTDRVFPCIGISGSLSQTQFDIAMQNAKQIGVEVHQINLDELRDEKYAANNADRCFYCKSHLFSVLQKYAEKVGASHVLCGSNFDDKDDFRPGNKAAEVFGVRAPLMEAELTKTDIRHLSRMVGLNTADMPASPCLASRIAYGIEITEENLKQVELAEDFLRSFGLTEFRVRHHGSVCRIEVKDEDFNKIVNHKKVITSKFKEIGFKFVSLDLAGFKSGALNQTLSEEQKNKALGQ